MITIKYGMRGMCIASVLFWIISVIFNISISMGILSLGVIISAVISICAGEIIEAIERRN